VHKRSKKQFSTT